MAKDKHGTEVKIGDYVATAEHNTIARVVGLRETTKETRAVGAFVDIVGSGRVKRFPFDPAQAHLVRFSNGDFGPTPTTPGAAHLALTPVATPKAKEVAPAAKAADKPARR